MTKTQETEIKRVVLNLGGKEISLTIEQCKKLKDVLNDMFGKEIIKEVIVDHRHHYDWWYSRPYYSTTILSADVKYDKNIVYCSL